MATHRNASPSNIQRLAGSDPGALLAGGQGLALLTIWLCIIPFTPALVLGALVARNGAALKRKLLRRL